MRRPSKLKAFRGISQGSAWGRNYAASRFHPRGTWRSKVDAFMGTEYRTVLDLFNNLGCSYPHVEQSALSGWLRYASHETVREEYQV